MIIFINVRMKHYAKWLLCFIFLSSCSVTTNKIDNIKTIPTAWSSNGKVNVQSNQQNQSFNFKIEFNKQNYKLTLTSILGFKQIEIHSLDNQLLINGDIINNNIKQLMIDKYGWYLPIEYLAEILFLKNINSDEWELKILSVHENKLPKIINLINKNKNIKIKFVFKKISLI